MIAFQNSIRRPFVLFTAGIALLITAIFWKSFPVFVFVAFAPLFALLDVSWPSRSIYFIIAASVVGVLSELFLYNVDLNTPVLLYIFLVAGLFATFISAQQLTQNRLNKFTLLIVFMAMEYLLVKLMVQTNPVFLADILRDKSDWIRWNIFTGYQGISFWILTTNLLFYQAIFKSRQVNLFLCLVGLCSIALPILYSHNLENNAITKKEVLDFYSGKSRRRQCLCPSR